MPSFANPFGGNVPKKMTDGELAQAIRIDLASELEAIFLYEAHAAATDNKLAAKVLLDIANEEKEHMGELMALLQTLDGEQFDAYIEGQDEVKEMMEELGIKPKAELKLEKK